LNLSRQILKSNFIEYNKKKQELGIPGTNQFIKAKKEGRVVVVSEETRKKLGKINKGKQLTENHKNKLKIAMRKAVLENPNSYSANNVSGRTPIIEYNGFRLKGSWELLVAKWLDENNIKWTNIIEGFDYEWEESKHIYYPDFYLLEYDKYIEVKGFERERDRCKWKVVSNLIIIKKDDITKIKNKEYKLED
jgi:hypothetical protein